MNSVSWVKRSLTFLALLVSMFAIDAAYASPQICNRTNILVSVAIAWYGSLLPACTQAGGGMCSRANAETCFPTIPIPPIAITLPIIREIRNTGTQSSLDVRYISGRANCLYGRTGLLHRADAGAGFDFADAAYASCSPPNLRRGFVHIEEGADDLGLSGTGEDSDVYLTDQNGRLGSATW